LFERGRDFERGQSPLSYKLPSPARNVFEDLTMFLAGEGFTLKGFTLKGYRGKVSANNQKQTEQLSSIK